mmetsp:Transcript_1163/g.4351  ORF Transcript_1163/g.4351 Transcript_1163/m.4351 type:complete len:270 (-) Transcript_1163:454-1263(-)
MRGGPPPASGHSHRQQRSIASRVMTCPAPRLKAATTGAEWPACSAVDSEASADSSTARPSSPSDFPSSRTLSVPSVRPTTSLVCEGAKLSVHTPEVEASAAELSARCRSSPVSGLIHSTAPSSRPITSASFASASAPTLRVDPASKGSTAPPGASFTTRPSESASTSSFPRAQQCARTVAPMPLFTTLCADARARSSDGAARETISEPIFGPAAGKDGSSSGESARASSAPSLTPAVTRRCAVSVGSTVYTVTPEPPGAMAANTLASAG